MIEIRPCVTEDFPLVCNRANDKTVRAFTVVRDGEPVAIAGISLDKSRFIVFSDIKEGVTAPKMTIFRTGKKLVARIKELNLPAITTPCHTGKFLMSIGMEYVGSCDKGQIFRI